jgi:hypothetical protein
MRTTVLGYDVIGKLCPYGVTAENCHLRKKLAELEKKYEIGYRILENGNLLVPKWFSAGQEPNYWSFNLEKTIKETCGGTCYRENRKKGSANPTEYREQPQICTVIFAYVFGGCNCPNQMNVDNCPLRKSLRETEQEYNIGYQELSQNTLLIPNKHYNSRTNWYRDVAQRKADICSQCFKDNRQK